MPIETGPKREPDHRQILTLAVPMILSNLSVPLLGLVDTAVMGHLPGPEYLGAVAVGSVVFSFIFWGFGFLRMGTTGFVAQAWGRGDRHRLAQRVAQAFVLAVLLGLALLLLQWPIEALAMPLLDASPAVESGARTYFGWRIWAAPATLLNYVVIGALLGSQNARGPLLVMLTTNAVNALLDVVFVVGLEFGVRGVALASVIGESCGLAVGLLLMARSGLLAPGLTDWARVLNGPDLRAMVKVNTDILLRTLCLIFAFAFFTRQGAQMGEVVLAANAVLLNFQHFMSYGLDGFAHAAEALVGRTLGAGDETGLRGAVRKTGMWSAAVAAVFAAVYAVSGEALIGLLTDLENVRAVARSYLPWLVALPLVSVWSFWLDGVFVGATLGREMRDAMGFAAFAVYLPVWYLSQPLGNHGLWLALTAFMAARAVAMAWLWRRRSPVTPPG